MVYVLHTNNFSQEYFIVTTGSNNFNDCIRCTYSQINKCIAQYPLMSARPTNNFYLIRGKHGKWEILDPERLHSG